MKYNIAGFTFNDLNCHSETPNGINMFNNTGIGKLQVLYTYKQVDK